MNYKTTNMKKIFVLVPLVAVSLFSFAQDDEKENLVENGSFEETKGKVRRLGQIDAAEGWTAATGSGADLFCGDAKMPDVMTPENERGTEEAHEGMNYAGILAFSYGDKEERTYITTRLAKPLRKGERYKVEFYASLSDLSKYSSNKLAAHMSKRQPGTDEKVDAITFEENLVLHPKESILDGMFGWDKVCGEYIANGGEKYITIGNFTNSADVKNERMRKPQDVKGKQVIAAYYYIDEVSVYQLEEDEECDCEYETAPKMESLLIFQNAPLISPDMSSEEKVDVQGIYYAYGKFNITPAGVNTLKFLAAEYKKNQGAVLKVNGHVDASELEKASESADYKDLGLKRATFVKNLLVNLGVPENNIQVTNKNASEESDVLEESDTDELRMAKNRRVTFELVK